MIIRWLTLLILVLPAAASPPPGGLRTGRPVSGAPPETASPAFRLADFVPNGGQARMTSPHFCLLLVASPPPAEEMCSARFRIRPRPDRPLRPVAYRLPPGASLP